MFKKYFVLLLMLFSIIILTSCQSDDVNILSMSDTQKNFAWYKDSYHSIKIISLENNYYAVYYREKDLANVMIVDNSGEVIWKKTGDATNMTKLNKGILIEIEKSHTSENTLYYIDSSGNEIWAREMTVTLHVSKLEQLKNGFVYYTYYRDNNKLIVFDQNDTILFEKDIDRKINDVKQLDDDYLVVTGEIFKSNFQLLQFDNDGNKTNTSSLYEHIRIFEQEDQFIIKYDTKDTMILKTISKDGTKKAQLELPIKKIITPVPSEGVYIADYFHQEISYYNNDLQRQWSITQDDYKIGGNIYSSDSFTSHYIIKNEYYQPNNSIFFTTGDNSKRDLYKVDVDKTITKLYSFPSYLKLKDIYSTNKRTYLIIGNHFICIADNGDTIFDLGPFESIRTTQFFEDEIYLQTLNTNDGIKYDLYNFDYSGNLKYQTDYGYTYAIYPINNDDVSTILLIDNQLLFLNKDGGIESTQDFIAKERIDSKKIIYYTSDSNRKITEVNISTK